MPAMISTRVQWAALCLGACAALLAAACAPAQPEQVEKETPPVVIETVTDTSFTTDVPVTKGGR